MPTVNDVLRQKGQSVISIEGSATVLDAVRAMNEHHVGAILVMEQETLVGIFTERDVLRRVVTAELAPHDIRVRDIMTPNVLCCGVFTDLDEIAQTIQTRRIRHLPIRDGDDHIVGVISIGDVNAFNVAQKQATIEHMTDYICGRS